MPCCPQGSTPQCDRMATNNSRSAAQDALLALSASPEELDLKHLEGQRVLLRADLNVPLDKNTKQVTDDTRIKALLPTLQLLLDGGAKVLITSHFGRPEPGKQSTQAMLAQYSLQPVAHELANCLGSSFLGLTEDCIGNDVDRRASQLRNGQALLLENVRFHQGETSNDDGFAKALANNCSIFVNDAFGVVHRAHASVVGVTKFVPRCLPGLLIRKELDCLVARLHNPRRPFAVVLGGAKVADKLELISVLIDQADKVLIGGKMAFTFLLARGIPVGKTAVEEVHRVQEARDMEKKAAGLHTKFLLPVDQVVARQLAAGSPTQTVSLARNCCTAEDGPCIPEGYQGGDIGPSTERLFVDELEECNTIFWNGPLGMFEVPEFAHGTRELARCMARATRRGVITIVGGGDSVAAVHEARLSELNFTHISTGGGASLELIKGKVPPGLQVLM